MLQEAYGYQPHYLTKSDATGKLTALLPLMEVSSWLTGKRGVGLPFTDLVEPLCSDPANFRELIDAALALGRARGWKYLECRGGKSWQPEAPASTSFLRHTLTLNVGEATLLAGFDDSVRRAMRKAERSGVKVEFSRSPEAMNAFYGLMCQTRRRHGVPPQPYRFFTNIQRYILAEREQGWIVLGRDASGLPVAGAIFLHFNRRAIYKFGASDENRQELRANNLVFWRSIQHYANAGFLEMDFGRTSLGNEGLRKFKLGWGTREESVEYTRFDFRTSGHVTAKDEAQGWHNQIFRNLPLPLSRLAGRFLYRHIA
ncbi:GNAT family N-acetyltransferase [Oleiharenicola lentus]|uniref:GNAT family N-acetyltransferase n=1 Tax=Oleiharenicola lentus TaxID=2508720 RepID=A0A4Q1C3D6_9BACT|nr:GNAT family N-acetyltransferase [Oleiharenicola lentus]RXK52908.1 GNAT family N-acetyltransferase [Oleiharenicola lentus]